MAICHADHGKRLWGAGRPALDTRRTIGDPFPTVFPFFSLIPLKRDSRVTYRHCARRPDLQGPFLWKIFTLDSASRQGSFQPRFEGLAMALWGRKIESYVSVLRYDRLTGRNDRVSEHGRGDGGWISDVSAH